MHTENANYVLIAQSSGVRDSSCHSNLLLLVDGALLVNGAVLRKNIIAWDVILADLKNTGTRLESTTDCMINWQSLHLEDQLSGSAADR
jgi:hypothetical protein